jgi:dolichol-phosphate mannosyltransferase
MPRSPYPEFVIGPTKSQFVVDALPHRAHKKAYAILADVRRVVPGRENELMTTSELSFVIPVKDEEATVRDLFNRIRAAVTEIGRPFEVVFIDDGSDDDSWAVIRSIVEENEGRARGIRFRRNLGKAAALSAGFRAARGEIVFTLDADLQDDPKEIPRFLAKLDEGYDIVSGWKKVRHDPWHKVLPSRIFNRLLSAVSKTRLHDHNCGFKCYRARVVKELALYGEMHRMVPALGTIRGFKSSEIEVTHHPRRFGQSKYGVKRFLRGFMDMLTVGFLRNYRERPLHLFGGMAITFGVLGVLLVMASLVPFLAAARPAFGILGGSLIASALPLLGLGFLSELMVSTLTGMRPALPIAEEVPARSERAIAPASSHAELPRSVRTVAESAPTSVRNLAVARRVADEVEQAR